MLPKIILSVSRYDNDVNIEIAKEIKAKSMIIETINTKLNFNFELHIFFIFLLY